MIKISGAVTVKTINGRNGPFNVGKLVTEVGEFSVKEGIEEFDPGQYEGEFTISRIYQASYAIGGRSITEVRATLVAIALTGLDTTTAQEEEPPAEPEPELPATGVPSEDKALFGQLWPLGEKVKLDPTVDREILRRQATRLKELGYRFQPVGRIFVKGEPD
ncbi:MAG: DUF3275 family protein [Gammaproteobacteria bacterium]